MKVTLDLPVRFMDVDSEGKLRINTLLAYLQEAAIWHASQCGDSPDEIRARGAGWALIKLGVQISGDASYGDTVEVETWSRGSAGLKAYRDFIVRSKDRVIARGSSIWVYLNIQSGRMMRIEAEHMARYLSDPDLATDLNLDEWKPVRLEAPDSNTPITIRSQDIDTNQHVNNTQYAALADTALRAHLGRRPTYQEIRLSFERSIEPDTKSAQVNLAVRDDGNIGLEVGAEGSVCCRGQAMIAPFQP